MNDITSDKTVKLTSPVDIGVIRVTLAAGTKPADAVLLQNGCTGHIRSIVVETWVGDGIHINAGCHDLEIDNIHVVCYDKPAGKHQDGVQVMGGKGVHVHAGFISALSANNSQAMIHTGAGGQQVPEDVIFDNLTVDPRGAGSYGLSNGEGIACGFTNITMLSRSNNHDLYQGRGTKNPQWSFVSLPPGVRSNFDRSQYPGG